MNGARRIAVLTAAVGLVGCVYDVPAEDRPFVDGIVVASNALVASNDLERVLATVKASSFDHRSDLGALQSDDGSAILSRLRDKSTDDVVCRRAVLWFFHTKAWEGGGKPQLRCSQLRDRTEADWVGTLVHERAHAAGYLHRGNARTGNECTVPHFVGDLAVYLAAKRDGKAKLPDDVCPELKTVLGE